MNRSITQIRSRMETSLGTIGLSPDEAALVANDYLQGELQGKESHGLLAFPALLTSYSHKGRNPKIVRQSHAALTIDANNTLGVLIAEKYSQTLIDMAKNEGVAVCYIKNMFTWLRPGSIAQSFAQKNLVSMVVNNGGRPMVAPPGGFDPVIGTNPIGIGIPGAKDPLVADMATSTRAWGEIKKAIRFGTKLPDNTYFDNTGNFTKNPADAHSVLAMGDYKGFALGLFIEILTGSFLGRAMGKSPSDKDYQTLERGAVIVLFDPAFTTDINTFKVDNEALYNKIRASRKRAGVKEILTPGQNAFNTLHARMDNGTLEIEDSLWEKL